MGDPGHTPKRTGPSWGPGIAVEKERYRAVCAISGDPCFRLPGFIPGTAGPTTFSYLPPGHPKGTSLAHPKVISHSRSCCSNMPVTSSKEMVRIVRCLPTRLTLTWIAHLTRDPSHRPTRKFGRSAAAHPAALHKPRHRSATAVPKSSHGFKPRANK